MMFHNNTMSRKRRDLTYIIAEILEITKNASLKTQIMYKGNLSFSQLNGYLNFLLDVRLLKKIKNEEKFVYITTRKGISFLQVYYKISDLLQSEGKKRVNHRNGWENWGALCLGNHRNKTQPHLKQQ